ncbi:hypothetical protein BDQ17DRAFT_1335638 [Cyathus striatus]|nr:hypothetical protein BDQ17DRAFT_1335638 [Cyathus striatus]
MGPRLPRIRRENIARQRGTVSDKLLESPGYIITVSDPPENLNAIDIAQTVSANLFNPGSNLSLPGVYSPGPKEALPPHNPCLRPSEWILSRIGRHMAFTRQFPALRVSNIDNNHLRWNCSISNTDAVALWARPAGNPRVWWDSRQVTPDDMTPDLKENAWYSLGRYGDTAAMKQVFTVTKDNRRHTFLESVMKVSMLTYFPPFQNNDVIDLIRRIWDDDPTFPVSSNPDSVAQVINAFSLGYLTQQDYGVHAFSMDVLNIANTSTTPPFANFRIITSNITLIRSETIDTSPVSFASCPSGPYVNLAYGGRVRSTTCDTSGVPRNDSLSGFLGQFDTSSVLMFTNALGDGSTNSSNGAFSTTGLNWYDLHVNDIDNALLSRAFVLGGDPSNTQVLANTLESALSYLQLILICVPALFAVFAWLLMSGTNRKSYYKSSFLSAVCTTTHITDGKCVRVEYLRNPPEIELRVSRNEHVVVGTPGRGTLATVGPNEVVAFAMNMEPFLRSPASMAYLEGNDNASSVEEVFFVWGGELR